MYLQRLRLVFYAELVLAARRDIARSNTRIGAVEIIGMRVNDLYTNVDYYRLMTLPFDEVCRLSNWTPPWSLRDGIKSSAKQSTINSSVPPGSPVPPLTAER